MISILLFVLKWFLLSTATSQCIFFIWQVIHQPLGVVPTRYVSEARLRISQRRFNTKVAAFLTVSVQVLFVFDQQQEYFSVI